MRSIAVVIMLFSLFLTACAPENTRDTDYAKAARINIDLGIAYMNEGDYNTAIQRLEKAEKLDSENPVVHSSLGLLHARLGQLEKAEEYFRYAVKLAPKNSDIHNNFGAFLCKQKRYAEAEQQFMAAIGNPLYRTPEYAYLNAGLCVDDSVKSEKYFRRALQINPGFAAALYQMAKLSYEKERYLSARAYLQRYSETGVPTAATLWLGIQVERKLGDRLAVRRMSSQLKEGFPDTEETRLLLETDSND